LGHVQCLAERNVLNYIILSRPEICPWLPFRGRNINFHFYLEFPLWLKYGFSSTTISTLSPQLFLSVEWFVRVSWLFKVMLLFCLF
jgi:hypothetical protein